MLSQSIVSENLCVLSLSYHRIVVVSSAGILSSTRIVVGNHRHSVVYRMDPVKHKWTNCQSLDWLTETKERIGLTFEFQLNWIQFHERIELFFYWTLFVGAMNCPVCDFPEEAVEWMHVHCILKHPKEFVTCPWCTVPFASLRALQNHTKECPALNKNELREGKIKLSFVNDVQCLWCEGRFATHLDAMKHYKHQHLNYSYICPECNTYFQQNVNLDKHYAESHPKASVPMDQPISSVRSRRLVSKRAVSAAVNSNTDNGLANPWTAIKKKSIVSEVAMSTKTKFMKWFNQKRCFECKLDFETTPEIEEHFQMEHQTAVFICDDCNNAYLSASSRYRHRSLKHSAKRLRLDAHSSTSTSVQTLTCPHPQCNYEETSPVLYLAHVTSMHVEQCAGENYVKSEGADEAGSASLLDAVDTIKTEPNNHVFLPSSNCHQGYQLRVAVPEEMRGKTFDLTSDEDAE